MDPEIISRFTATFEDPVLEAGYRQQAFPKVRRAAMSFCLIPIVASCIGIVRDLVVRMPDFTFLEAWAVLLAITLGSLWGLSRAAKADQLLPPARVQWCAACIFLTFIYATHPIIVPGKLATVFVFLYLAVSPVFWAGTMSGAIVFTVILTGLLAGVTLWRVSDGLMAFQVIVGLVLFGLGGVLLAHRQHNAARHDYLALLKERQLRLQLAQEKLAAESATRAKGDFLAVMSHEIRTPMSGIIGMARLLLEEGLAPKHHEMADMLRVSAESLLVILDDILDFSKLEAGRIEFEAIPFDPRLVVDEVLRGIEVRAAAKGLSLAFEAGPDLPQWVAGDPGRLRQVLFNLVGNAVKFTDAGSVTVQLAVMAASEGMVAIEFAVIDTGIGIAEELRHRLFQSFYQADASVSRRYGGTGLGLSICKRLVEAQGGEIGVESQPGFGSRFWFRLAFLPAEAPAAIAAPAPATSLRPLRILLAEDNAVNRKVAMSLLARGGHGVTVAMNGREALDLARAGTFDLILMDIQMPEMDGLEATRAIRALPSPGCRIPVIALTANAMRGDLEQCLAAGMDDYVSKPIDPLKLEQAMARALAKG